MKTGAVLGVHGVVLDVADPEREACRWRRALGLPLLRRSRREVVLGSVAFFVTLRRAARNAAATVSEVHVAVEGLSGVRVAPDPLGGRHRAVEVAGARLIVRELRDAPSRKWLRTRKRKRTKAGGRARKSRGD